MVDVVGLRFVTQGERQALAALDAYERGLMSSSQVAEKHFSVINRELRRRDAEERRAYQNYLRYNAEKVRAAESEARAQEQAAQRAARATAQRDAEDRRAYQRYLRYQQEREQAAQREARAQEQAAQRELRAREQVAQSFARLQASINPTIAAQQRMRQVHETVRAALAAEIITREEAARTLREYRASAQGVAAAQTGMGAASMFASRAQNATGMAMQQVGYQAGDFLVQIQSGTNAFVAFGQQATQLVGILPMFGSVLGVSGTALIGLSAGLGIAIPLMTALGAAFMRTRKDSEDSAKGVETLEDRLKSLDRTLQDYLRTREAARSGVTVEELLGLEGLDEAAAAVTRARENLARTTTANTASILTGGFGFTGLARAARAEEEAAIADLIKAETRLANLRRKHGEEQFKTFSERLVQYQEEIALAQTAIQFGQDSSQYRQREAQQALDSELRRIDALLRGEEITVAQAGALRRQAVEQQRVTQEADATAAAAERISRAIARATAETANFANALAQARNESAGIGISTSGVQAEIAALQAGASRAEARAEAAAVTLRTQLNAELPGQGIGPQGALDASRRIEAEVEARRQLVLTQEQLLEQRNALTREDTKSGGGTARERATLEAAVATMTKRIAQERELMSLSGQARREREIAFELEQKLADSKESFSAQQIAAAARQIAAAEQVNDTLKRQVEMMQRVGETLERSMSDGFTSIVDGTKTAGEAFRDMARMVVAELFKVLVVQQLVGQFKGGGGGILGMVAGGLGFANGGAFSGGNVMPFANGAVLANMNRAPGTNVIPFATGGVVGSPTTFPMSGGRTGLMGEAGPEAIMPLKRGRDGKLGVASQSMSLNVTVTMDPSTGALGAFVRNEAGQVVASAAPQIVDASKAAILDSRRRGGAMRSTFR